MLIAVFGLIGVVVGWNLLTAAMMQKSLGAGGMPPATVSTTTAHAQDWQETMDAVGSLRAVRGVDVSTEIAGLCGA